MKILVVGLVENDHVIRLREEAEKRGHTVEGCFNTELTIYAHTNRFEPTLREKPLKEFDLIYFWAPKEKRWDWFASAEYLHTTHGTIIVNKKVIDPTYNYNSSITKDYLELAKAGISSPKTLVTFSDKSFDFAKQMFSFPFIVKSSKGKQGKSVFKIENDQDLAEAYTSISEDTESATVFRELIPNDGDIRVFCLGYKAIGAMKRTPKEGEFRSNISQGGFADPFELKGNPAVQEIAEKAAYAMRTEIAGVDVMINKETGVPYILEVNPGPQFLGIESTGINVAEKIVEYFEKLYETKPR